MKDVFIGLSINTQTSDFTVQSNAKDPEVLCRLLQVAAALAVENDPDNADAIKELANKCISEINIRNGKGATKP